MKHKIVLVIAVLLWLSPSSNAGDIEKFAEYSKFLTLSEAQQKENAKDGPTLYWSEKPTFEQWKLLSDYKHVITTTVPSKLIKVNNHYIEIKNATPEFLRLLPKETYVPQHLPVFGYSTSGEICTTSG